MGEVWRDVRCNWQKAVRGGPRALPTYPRMCVYCFHQVGQSVTPHLVVTCNFSAGACAPSALCSLLRALCNVAGTQVTLTFILSPALPFAMLWLPLSFPLPALPPANLPCSPYSLPPHPIKTPLPFLTCTASSASSCTPYLRPVPSLNSAPFPLTILHGASNFSSSA